METHLEKYDEKSGILYHASSKKFTFPSWQEIDNPKHDACEKRILGLWAADYQVDGFGDYCYKIEIKDNARLMSLDLEHLIKFHKKISYLDNNPIKEYEELRALWQKEADVVYLKDARPGVGEVIIVNFDVIKSFSLCKEPENGIKKLKMS